MIIKRDKYLEITYENLQEKERIELILNDMCIRDNPEYTKMVETGRWKKDVQKKSQTFKKSGTTYYVYKGNLDVLNELYKQEFKIRLVDNRVAGDGIDIPLLYQPRDTQQRECAEALKLCAQTWGYGMIDASPAFGKTYMGVNAIKTWGRKTLILIDMDLLLDQWIESITEYTGLSPDIVGVIKADKEETNKPIIISTVQTLIKKEKLCDEICDSIGTLIIDEVHVASCETFQQIIPRFRPTYMLGLSGSHNRDDGMDFLIKEAVGPIVYRADRQRALAEGSILNPVLRPIFFRDDENFIKNNKDKNMEFRDVIDEYYKSDQIISRLANLVKSHYDLGDSQLIICKEKEVIDKYYKHLVLKVGCTDERDRQRYKEMLAKKVYDAGVAFREAEAAHYKEYLTPTQKKSVANKKRKLTDLKDSAIKKQAEDIKKKKKLYEKLAMMNWYDQDEAIEETNIKRIKILTGDNSKKDRDEAVAKAKIGEIKIIITTTLLDKAISINCLNVLYLPFSTRERANLKQRAGRISRPAQGKSYAIVYDIIYDHFMSFYQFTNAKGDCRMTAYKEVTDIPKGLNLLTWWLSCRFRDEKVMPPNAQQDFIENYYDKFVVEM